MATRRMLVLLTLAAGIVAGACAPAARVGPPDLALDDDAVTIGSFDFAENELLAEIYGQALEAGGIRVRRAFDLGPREFVLPALVRGLVEMVPEYAGTAAQFLGDETEATGRDAATTRDVLESLLADRGVAALEPAAAQNANAFVVRRDTSEGSGLHALSDLERLSPNIVLGGPPECPLRVHCLRGLEEVYGLAFKEVLALDTGGPLTRQAVLDGDVDVALLFTTDPALGAGDLVELTDDRGLQPAENITPLVRSEVLERWGADLRDRIDAVSAHLTTDGLRELNARHEASGGDTATVASDWLTAVGLA